MEKKKPNLCELCSAWEKEISANHAGGKRFLINSTPHLWPTDKWEVAKVHMPSGHKNHKSVGDFDISAFLTLMTQCKHFKHFVKDSLCTKVVYVRNQVMHSASLQVKLEDLHDYLDQIRALANALEEQFPEFFKSLSKEIDELQNLDFSLVLHGAQAADTGLSSQDVLNMELQSLKEKMECLTQLYEDDRQKMPTPEELHGMKVFLKEVRDLPESLVSQWERLSRVQEQQGQQIDSLTGRVEQLERRAHTPEPESSTSIPMYKNHLFELAKEKKWPEPDFSVIREGAGVRGQVTIKDQTFTGLQVHKSKIQAHQEVAKVALEKLASEEVDGGDSVSQSESAAQAEPESSTSIPMYKNHLFELAKDKKWPEPDFSVIREGAGVRGQVRIKDQKFTGLQVHKSKIQAHQEVAKLALEHLANEEVDGGDPVSQSESAAQAGFSFFGSVTMILNTTVFPDQNSAGTEEAMESAYKKLVPLFGLDLSAPESSCKEAVLQYCQSRDVPPPEESNEPDGFFLRLTGQITFYDSKGSSNKKQANQQAAKAALQGLCGVLGNPAVMQENYVGALNELLQALSLGKASFAVTETPGKGVTWVGNSQMPHLLPADTSMAPGTQGTAAKPRERNFSGPSFFGNVTMILNTRIFPDQSSAGTEEAAESVYKKLVDLFGLDLSASDSSCKEAVLQYCQSRDVPPPEESNEPDGFFLRLTGQITFYDSKGSRNKKQANQQAAKAALQGLCGVLGNPEVMKENYVGALNELLQAASLGKASYAVTETPGKGVTWVGNSQMPHLLPADTSMTPGTQATPAKPRERNFSGPSFFGNVTMILNTRIFPDQSSAGTEEAAESVYKKLVDLFGLDLSASDSSCKEAVLQYCQSRDVPPPEESNEPDGFFLRLTGQITFYDSRGSSNKKQANQQAAKAALQGLCGVLGNPEVMKENYVGALNELLQALNLGKASFAVTETPGKGVTWVGNSQMPHLLPADTSMTPGTQATPTKPRERNISGDGGQFLGFVTVTIQKDLKPFEASSQEGAVQAAYSSLLTALCLGPAAATVGERQTVLQFFTQKSCRPPLEDSEITTDGRHRCTLKINGALTFCSAEGASRKQWAEQLAAKEALRHLELLLSSELSGGENYKGRLQELLVKHGSGVMPEYKTRVHQPLPQ
ncbi:uncharacterized protein [Centroberyx affinis]|uniref:uncharacterized protein isoform X2 n=1 Tax=Centroberyx affinis TaxID=166261 RepID=UPI003A5BB7C4